MRATRSRGCLLLTVLLAAGPAAAGPNPDARIVLHLIGSAPDNECETPQAAGYDDCATETVTRALAGAAIDVYVYLERYSSTSGVQMQFAWDPSWTFLGWTSNCLPGQLDGEVPETSGDNYSTQFLPCASGGALAPLGWLRFIAGAPESFLTVGEHDSKPGTVIADCEGREHDPIPVDHRGSVGVETAGRNPCRLSPVEAASWGAVKQRFAGRERAAR